MRLVSTRPPDIARRLTFIAPVSAPASEASDAARERLFEGLDGRSISTASHTWQVRIYSISEEPAGWWLQLQLDGEPEYTITMRAPRFQTAHDTLVRLAHWLTDSHTDKAVTLA
jgi:hypothetical protein